MIKNYIFLGAPGAGKGTLASMLEKDKGIKHISTGEIFRSNIKNETPLGLKVKQIIASGEYVPDELTNEIVKDALNTDYIKENGFILDGYPRTINQAEFLKNNGIKISAVVLLEVSDETTIKRLVARARGKDDTPEVIKHRLEVYNTQTKPLIEFYKKEGLLVSVNVESTIEENYSHLTKELY